MFAFSSGFTDAGEQSVDVYVNISSRKLKLLFEMIPGLKTNNFVSEIMRSMEGNFLLLYIVHIIAFYSFLTLKFMHSFKQETRSSSRIPVAP